jgi:hypothetical protein
MTVRRLRQSAASTSSSDSLTGRAPHDATRRLPTQPEGRHPPVPSPCFAKSRNDRSGRQRGESDRANLPRLGSEVLG